MKLHIEIDTRTFVRFWLVVIGFAFFIYLLYLSRSALIILASAAFLAVALSGPVNFISKHIPGRSRVGASALAFLAVVLFLSAFLFVVVPPIVQQTLKLASSSPQLVQSATEQFAGIRTFINEYDLQPQIDIAVESVKQQSTSWLSGIGSGVISQLSSFFALLGTIVLTLVLTFLMLIEGPKWMKRIWGLYEDRDKMRVHRSIVSRMQRVVAGYVSGQLTVSGIGAIATGLIVFAISMFDPGVGSNLAFPAIAIAFVMSLIPMFGATIGGTLIGLLLLINSIPAAIAFVVFFIVYQQVENNYIAPKIQSKYLKLSPLIVLAAVTIGLFLFGLAGGIISIPIAGIIKVLIEEYIAHDHKKREKSKRPLQGLMDRLQDEK